MSAPPKLTKKQKKALAFRERKGGTKAKGKPKTFDDLDNDVPVDEDQDRAEAAVVATVAPGPVEAPERVRKAKEKAGAADTRGVQVGDEPRGSGKKRKRGEAEGDGDASAAGLDAEREKAKKKRKGLAGDAVATGAGEGDAKEGDAKAGGKAKKAQQRFILFVGNLKYTTTKEAVEKHFAKCDPPPTARLMTPKPSANSKPTAKSKGCAFVEFTHRNALQQGLKLHQSELDGRKINVELTAGGGGKGADRLEKLKQRNRALHEQRKMTTVKSLSSKKNTKGGEEGPMPEVHMERPQRYSSTSGVEQVPLKPRTWSIPEPGDEVRKRGSKKGKKRPAPALGTGVNAIPVG